MYISRGKLSSSVARIDSAVLCRASFVYILIEGGGDSGRKGGRNSLEGVRGALNTASGGKGAADGASFNYERTGQEGSLPAVPLFNLP